jgi:outer membrane protein
MKKLLVALMMILPLGAFAQGLKIGYVNKQEVLVVMPEYNAAMKTLEDMNLKYITEGKKLEEEFQRKYQEYAAQADTLDAAIRQYKENELARFQQSIQEFTKSADETLKKKQQELFMPIIAKMDEAIAKVGEQNGFAFILDNTAGIIAYKSAQTTDVAALVKKALGL